MRLTFLGTGTSTGVPAIGCQCAVCMSTDPRNHRLRTSALLQTPETQVLIDAGPDLRQQLLKAGVVQLDAVLLTHSHADHVAGLDDLRPLNMAQRASIPLYGLARTLRDVRSRFDYAFSDSSIGSSRPMLELCEIQSYQPFQLGDLEIMPLDVQHGSWAITGFRIGGLGYVTDASAIPAASLDVLAGLDVLVLNALRDGPHPTHFSLDQALAVIEQLRPRRALLVHMAHDLDHMTTNARLPDHVRLAYDGLVIEVTGLASMSNAMPV